MKSLLRLFIANLFIMILMIRPFSIQAASSSSIPCKGFPKIIADQVDDMKINQIAFQNQPDKIACGGSLTKVLSSTTLA
jgi:hypothetical protein